jgi:uncharacterized protein YfaP (DUF2135 family)
MDFMKFKIPVAEQFARMSGFPLFRVEVSGEELWEAYLAAFPTGSNPVFRERREHDCSACRHFVKALGNVVAIVDGEVHTIWDIVTDEPAYATVAATLAAMVKDRPIANIFLHPESTVGTDRNREIMTAALPTIWHHFFVHLPVDAVAQGVDIGPKLAEARALHDVFFRSLEELSSEAVDTVLELIAQGSLYRGTEMLTATRQFRQAQEAWQSFALESEKHIFVWASIRVQHVSVSKIRNTAIGTLLVDLSGGMELEAAVRRYEAVVAPQNYKRPTALVTKKQIDAAKATLTELGLLSALERRYAHLEDISINDLLFADRTTRQALGADVFDSLAVKTPAKSFDRVEEVSVSEFVRDVLPRVTALEVLFENRHAGNLVSLIAPVDPTARPLFKWPNAFSWSYVGDVADSIKERVKRAGGNVTGDLLTRLAWFNTDDLDLHMIEPNGYEISFRNKRVWSPSNGTLDVDMNVGGESRTPVENIFYPTRTKMREGTYKLFVHQFNKRESVDVGFEIEMEYLGTEHWRFVYEKPLRHNENVPVVEFHYSRERGIDILKSLPSSTAARELWGLKTQEFQPVAAICRSPNFWGGSGIGNEHYFFMLNNCRNDGTARGFYNEFLGADLNAHRKVLELVGAKMKTGESVRQLSGLGFSATRRDHIIVRAKGSFTRDLRVAF